MIGVFSYTVILTYLSLITGVVGIFCGFCGKSFIAVICLMMCGFLDGFDGRVARTKKNRTQFEKDFGVQIDSLCDIVVFGVLPIAIGFSMGLTSFAYVPIFVFYVLCGLIRLAYFNSLELENERKNSKKNVGYIGLPITCATFIFPLVYILRGDNSSNMIYSFALFITGLLFVSKIKISKPKKNIFVGIIVFGIIEFVLVLKGFVW